MSQRPQEPIRVVVADDHTIICTGIRTVLEQAGGIRVVATVAGGAAALRAVEHHRPEVLMLDLNLPDMSGFEVAQAVHSGWPGTAVLVHTTFKDLATTQLLVQAGVRGVLPKLNSEQELAAAVRAIAAGRTYLPAQALDALLVRPMLTKREQDVLRLMATGQRNAEIAAALRVTLYTIDSHLRAVYSKLGVRSRTEAAAAARRQGLLPPDLPSIDPGR